MREKFKRFVELTSLSNIKMFRKLAGGHWERWWVDHPICSDIWHLQTKCYKDDPSVQNPLMRGTPVCEHY